jgi:hypothetical protein
MLSFLIASMLLLQILSFYFCCFEFCNPISVMIFIAFHLLVDFGQE